MIAILKRELRGYFTTPIGYIYLGVFYFFASFYFAATSLIGNSTDISYVFLNLFSICIFLIPLLTMRLLSEDRRNKTDQLLLTAPVGLFGLVMGKFLAAFLIFAAGAGITLLFGMTVSALGQADWPVITGNLIGLLLLGAALVAIGLFISALTENQVIAAVGSFAAGLALMMTDAMASMVQSPLLKSMLSAISFNGHYMKFTQGMLDLADIVFFLSIVAVFLFFTIRAFERRRWR